MWGHGNVTDLLASSNPHQHFGEKEWFKPPGPGSFLLRRNSCSFSFTSVLAMAPFKTQSTQTQAIRTCYTDLQAPSDTQCDYHGSYSSGSGVTYSLCLSPCSSAGAVVALVSVSPALRVFVAPVSSSALAPAAALLPAAPVVAYTHRSTHTFFWMILEITEKQPNWLDENQDW